MNHLQLSINSLRERSPLLSAQGIPTRTQKRILLVGAVVVVGGLAVAPLATVIAVFAVAIALYLFTFLNWLGLVNSALRQRPLIAVDDNEARALAEDELPMYTVLVPTYHEAEIIDRTIAALEALDYPVERLDIKLLLEEDDQETIDAAMAARPASHISMVRVPSAEPRTKPKACNYGLTMATGELVTIFDAEDRPDPLQLRRAVAAFRRLDNSVVCLQAKLAFHNAYQNLLTRWFAVEYGSWFSMLLPAVAASGGPVPLGGTSVHIRRDVLTAMGAWDAYNVTEDADLGVRLYRYGYRTAVLDSTTDEEANSDFVNWVKERSRWHKGYMVTWLVHMRNPVRLWRDLGPGGFLRFNALIGGTPLVALINPLFWLITISWFTLDPALIKLLFPAWLFYPGLICMLAGNFFVYFGGVVATRVAGYPALIGAALLAPVYWLMMSIAAIKALGQLVSVPAKWEKTAHGLDLAIQGEQP